MYRVVGEDGVERESTVRAEIVGIRWSGPDKPIYGSLEGCAPAKRALKRCDEHPDTPCPIRERRVFLANERAAVAAGFRPCGRCFPADYREWKADPEAFRIRILG